MAFTLCLRVSDVASLRWGWLAHKNWMVFFDYKSAKEMCVQPIPPFWERWRQWLYEHRRPHHHDDALVLPGGPTHCGSYSRRCSREQSAASQAGTRGSGRGRHASERWVDHCRPSPYGTDGGHRDRQHDTRRTHQHGKCPPGCSCRDPQEIPGTSPEIANGSGCRLESYGMWTRLHGMLDVNGQDSRPRCKVS